jgi:hypothetical protein
VLVVGVGTTAWDAFFGSWGNFISSLIYLAALLLDVFWWPRQRKRILDNADRAAELAAPMIQTE